MKTGFLSTGGDNLYKFLAILGVALFISPAFLDKENQNVDIEIVDMQKTIAQRQRQIDALNREISSINKEQAAIASSTDSRDKQVAAAHAAIIKRAREIEKELVQLQNDKEHENRERVLALAEELRSLAAMPGLKGPTYEEMERELTSLQAKLGQIGTKLDAEDSLFQDNQFELKKLGVKIDYLEKANVLSVVTRTVGAFMTVVGFILWYGNVQRFADRYAETETRKMTIGRRRRMKSRVR
jgi:septal ring factor EnvC (AmiA/AmiB activator)